jgi:hypothetical protein
MNLTLYKILTAIRISILAALSFSVPPILVSLALVCFWGYSKMIILYLAAGGGAFGFCVGIYLSWRAIFPIGRKAEKAAISKSGASRRGA